MKINSIAQGSVAFLLCVILIGQQSCKKKESAAEPDYLTVNLPNATLKNDLYYSVSGDSRYIELEFSQAVDTATVQANISFFDKNSVFDTAIDLLRLQQKVVLMFHPSFHLKKGWSYSVRITTGLKSVSGLTFPSTKVIDVRTPANNLLGESDSLQRNAILCISDIHMGEYRAVLNHYCWFNENDSALTHLLDHVLATHNVKEVVILGDLFDAWVIPYRYQVFESSAGVNDIREYFLSVARSPVNMPVIKKLQDIAMSGDIRLIYIPGNHDMLLTRSILQEIIPGIIWQGTVDGIGEYVPVDEIIMEHGHRFDFFNCPQPLVDSGHMLPPGFFISRMQAECSRVHPGTLLKETRNTNGSLAFQAAWRVALDYLEIPNNMVVHEDSANIQMNGIDGYSSMFSYNSARDMYAPSIEDKWPATQGTNQVPVKIPVLMGILDGKSDLYIAVTLEYFSSAAPVRYKMAVFGHTHDPELKVYPPGKNYTSVYANTGSWVNPGMSTKPVRTFLMIWPGKWTGSDLDIVSLYQYNRDSGNGLPNPGYSPVLLNEESIIREN